MRNLPIIRWIITLLLLPAALPAQPYMAAGRLPLAPLPAGVKGVRSPVTSLSGTWSIQLQEGKDWQPVQVPGEAAMQGFAIAHDKPFRYRKMVRIPADAKGQAVAVRFNGVYSYARVWVNGQWLRDHHGGFTAWECDLTPHVKAGEEAELVVEVTDRTDEISFASGYAHHPIGGILRDVQLVVRPAIHLQRLYVQAGLSEDFGTGLLSMNVAWNRHQPGTSLAWALVAPDGRKVASGQLRPENGAVQHEAQIPRVKQWTAETPQLYRLEVTVHEQGQQTAQIIQHIGFRTVAVDGTRLLVNGRPVKLRGACRHDMDPLLGRSTHRSQDSLDVLLAKEANLNFIRTSHYPPSKDFLEFCDRYGIYVQEETAICFVGQDRGADYNKTGSSQNDTAYTARYLGQLSEMLDRDRNHAAVIMWSVGNESQYGSNFQQEYDFVKRTEPTRPVSWSWPATALKEGKRCFDIAVGHYPAYNGKGSDMGGIDKGMFHPDFPLLSDEWAHVACYNTHLLRYDPNVKDFWGRSMDTTWLARFDVPGNIGGAIWGMIDETFHLPGKVTGYGPWGFVDVWRRKKAEFWNTKKAHSPVRLMQTDFPAATAGDVLQIPVRNRFDHLLLSAITCRASAGGKELRIPMPATAPHESGVIALATKGLDGRTALLRFFDPQGNLVDEERVTWGAATARELPAGTGSWQYAAAGKGLARNGALEVQDYRKVSLAGTPLVTGLPQVVVNRPEQWNAFKNTAGVFSGNMTVADERVTEGTDKIVYSASGFAGPYPVAITVTYYPSGLVEIQYQADSLPAHTWETGVRIPVAAVLDKVSWQRKGYWTTYPTGHLSADSGTALKQTGAMYAYRRRPSGSIAEDMTDYYLNATTDEKKAAMPASESYRAKKEHIFGYELSRQQGPGRIRVISDGSQAAKMEVDAAGRQWLVVAGKWDYWSLSWGNYQGTRNPSRQAKGMVRLIIE